jgi:hypothetical protein
MNSDYIRGTQVTKDFQLIAEPIVPKLVSTGYPLSNQNAFPAIPTSA